MNRSLGAATTRASDFPAPPIRGSATLQPIRSWSDFDAEARVTGVEFDAFWEACVFAEVAYFFGWFGSVRATVLVVFEELGPIYIEVRRAHDVEVDGREAEPVISEVLRLFDGHFAAPARLPMH